ncbi:MAG: hypothetical protein NTX76_00550 [Alphaproteobacteria bacterium]|nr:hypothetical protein [Alphaproteobacteria bacterium]
MFKLLVTKSLFCFVVILILFQQGTCSEIFEKSENPLFDQTKIAFTSGMIRTSAQVVEHPLAVIMTQLQKSGPQSSLKNLTKFYAKVPHELYRGFIPACGTFAINNIYRFPIMYMLPSVLPESVSKIGTVASLAAVDTMVMLPLNAMTTKMITGGLNMRETLSPDLFHGFSTVYARQFAAWGTFIPAYYYFKGVAQDLNPDGLGFGSFLGIGSGIGTCYTAAVLPFDKTRTRILQKGAIDKSFVMAAKRIIAEEGWRGFYTGWRVDLPKAILFNTFHTLALHRTDMILKEKGYR